MQDLPTDAPWRATHQAVALAITRSMHAQPIAWCGVAKISSRARCDERTARRLLNDLTSGSNAWPPLFTRQRGRDLPSGHPGAHVGRGYVYSLNLSVLRVTSPVATADLMPAPVRDTGRNVRSVLKEEREYSSGSRHSLEKPERETSLSDSHQEARQRVFEAYKASADKPDSLLTPRRMQAIDRCLDLGFTTTALEEAMWGVRIARSTARHEFIGSTPEATRERGDTGVAEIRYTTRVFDDLTDILRFDDKVERLRDLWRASLPAGGSEPPPVDVAENFAGTDHVLDGVGEEQHCAPQIESRTNSLALTPDPPAAAEPTPYAGDAETRSAGFDLFRRLLAEQGIGIPDPRVHRDQ
jgi:hypothetical protein